MKTAINACTWRGYAKYKGSETDWKDFVRDAAASGYDGVELGGTRETLGEPAECLAFVREQGLEISAFAANVTYNPYEPNTRDYRASMDYAAELGVNMLMTCGGFIPNSRRNSYDFDYDIFAGNLGAAIDYAADKGLTLAYHPHRGAVVETIAETRKMIERLPNFNICIDIAHLMACYVDVVDFINLFHDRIVYTHIKDYHIAQDSFIELGHGDCAQSVDQCLDALIEHRYNDWLTVELDKKFNEHTDRTPLESARMNRTFLDRVIRETRKEQVDLQTD